MFNLYLHLRSLVRGVETGEASLEVLSTGERLAVLLVLDEVGRLHAECHTALSAIDRIGTEWTQAAIAVQRDGWRAAPSTPRQEIAHG